MKVFFTILLLVCTVFSMEIYHQTAQETPSFENSLKTIKYQCSYLEQNSIFSYKAVEDKFSDDLFNTPIVDDPSKLLFFSFCNDSNITCSNLQDQTRGSVLIRDKNTLNCIRVSSDNWDDAKVQYIKNPLGSSLDYLRLNWTGIDDCPFSQKPDGEKWKFSIDIVCIDSDYSNFTYTYTGGYNQDCKVRAQIQNKIGCAVVNFNKIWEFFEANMTIFAIVLIVSGLFLTIAGYRIVIVTLFMVGVIVTCGGITTVSYLFIIPKDAKNYVGWIVIG